MTTITLEVPDELAVKLEPLRAQLPRVLTLTLELMGVLRASHDSKAERLAALAEAYAIGECIRRWQVEQGVRDIDSASLLDQLRMERVHELATLH